MDSIGNFNIVLLGANFPVDKVDLSEFRVGDQRLQERLRLPIAVQASSAEYAVELLPDRVQIAAVNCPVTDTRIEALISAARSFIEEYAGRRSVVAVGHNFAGAASNSHVEGRELIRHLTWHEAILGILGSTVDPTAVLQLMFRRGNETQAGLRLEPGSVADQFAYDFNFHFAMNDREQKNTVYDAINLFSDSHAAASSILDRLTTFDPSNPENL